MDERHDRIDRLIKEALETELSRTPEPPVSKEEAWANIRQELLEDERRDRRVTFRKYTKVIGMAVVAAMLLLVAIFQPQVGSAFNWVKEWFLNTEGEVTELKGHVGGPALVPELESEVNPEGEEYTVVTQEMMSLEEAQKITDFDIVTPTHVPEGYSLEGVEVTLSEYGKSGEVFIHYSNGEDTIRIREMSTGEGMGYGMGVDSDDTQTKDVTVHGEQAVLFSFKDGSKKLVWEHHRIFFMLDSLDRDLKDDELLKIAETIE